MRGSLAAQGNRIDDTGLIREAQQGNRAAFEVLVRHYDQSVLRLALHLTGSESDAQDVYQEAFLKAYKNLGSFRFECSFYTWIYRIVTNLCLDHLRKRNVRKEDAPVAVDASGEEYSRLEQFADVRSGANPERDLMRRELGRKIGAALSTSDASRAHGVRVEALSRAEAAHGGRDAEYDGRDGEEYVVSRDAETAQPRWRRCDEQWI